MKQNPALRLLRKVKATNLREGSVAYHSLTGSHAALSGSGLTPSKQAPAGNTSVDHTDSDLVNLSNNLALDASNNYLVTRLYETDEVRLSSRLSPLPNLKTTYSHTICRTSSIDIF
jgi:hypothetical protein